jgi:hypothetical protein
MGRPVNKILSFVITTALLSLVASCTTAPPPVARPVAGPALPPPAKAAPLPADWRDLPLSSGGWSYIVDPSGSSARFGPAGAPALVLRCDKGSRRVHFALSGAAAGADRLVVTTSYGARSLPLAAVANGPAEATLPANDPLLDQIAFSRGRVSYRASATLPLLMTPAWAEPARVIEDCRS